jgi:hypothetical protein
MKLPDFRIKSRDQGLKEKNRITGAIAMSELRQLIRRRHERLALPRTKPLLRALRKADEAREALRQAEAEIQACFEVIPPEEFYDEPEISNADRLRLQQGWAEFRLEGGITETDFRNWLEGKPIAMRLNNKTGCAKKHLHLVAVKPALSRLRLSPCINTDPPEAA